MSMKKTVVIAMLAIFFGKLAYSQTDEFVMTWAIVESEAKKSDLDVANAKKAVKSKTWTERGRKYMMVYTFDAENIFYGITQQQVPIIMKTGATSERQSGDTTIMSYDRVDFYIVDGSVVKYERTGRAKEFFFPTHTAALEVATESYLKAKELDPEGKLTPLLNKQLKTISDYYQREGLFYYYAKDYKNAAVYYTKSGNIINTGLTGDSDSARIASLNNCGIINRAAEDYNQAITFFQDALKIAGSNQTSSMYDGIYSCQMENKDTAAAIQTCLTVVDKFPSDSNTIVYLNQLIDLYQKTNQSDLAITYLNKAIEKDPSNSLYYVVLANAYENQKKSDLAIETYQKALQINPKDENANLNLGVLYENKGNDALRAADALYGKKGYQTKVDEGKGYMKKAYPFIETYAEVTTDTYRKRNAYFDLMSIYMKLGLMDNYKVSKAKYDALKIK